MLFQCSITGKFIRFERSGFFNQIDIKVANPRNSNSPNSKMVNKLENKAVINKVDKDMVMLKSFAKACNTRIIVANNQRKFQ